MKRTDKENLAEILWCCMKLQQLGWGDLFYNLSGHVSSLAVWGYENGIKDNYDRTIDFNSYFGESEYLNEHSGYLTLEKLLSKLQIILINK